MAGEKPRIFRDPVHGLIGFRGPDAALRRVLDTPAFQRLRRVRQMGFASLVYPGAEHSRFGHALGAFHVAGRVTAALGLPAEVARDVKAAALLHDIGHGPFSHAWEDALGQASHEEWGRRMVTEDAELSAALAEIDPELPARLERFFAHTYRPRYARKLVSSQLDVDRMDYLLRDAHYSGVGYSAFDLEWVVHALRVERVREGDDPDDLVLDLQRGVHAVEQFLFGRFYMYAQVYYHKTVRAAEAMFLAVMRRFAELCRRGEAPPGLEAAARMARGEAIEVADYLRLDDARVQVALDGWADSARDETLRDLAARLQSRRLWKTIELGDDPAVVEAVGPALAEEARRRLGDRAGAAFTIDRAERLGYEPKRGEELYVVGHPELGTVELGELVRVGRRSFTVRVICTPELLEPFEKIISGRA
jgi:HD superfamily phosphohydrolase